ncbi:MAG: sigma-70 family RNA polymerase sigma factor [Planctomycetes bacterium]|nr:sigma-70 family RNA polymerase sigma factor [Planctomycetota bacterium]
MSPDQPQELAEFVELLTRHQLRLFQFIVSLVADRTEAEEIRQNTNVVLWQKAAEFKRDTNFVAWACRVAHFEILKERQRRGRRQVQLSDETLEQLATQSIENSDLLESRRQALSWCMERLAAADSTLITARYQQGEPTETIAARIQRTVDSVRHSLSRIRRQLKRCVDGRLARTEHS